MNETVIPEAPAAFQFFTAGAKTMADDTLRLQIDISPKDAAEAFRIFGQRGVAGAIARLNDDAAGQQDRDDLEAEAMAIAGKFWNALIASGFFRAPKVLRAIGPESAFEDWIRGQQAFLGPNDYDEKTNDIRNQCAHVRRVAEGSGTAERPPYFAVPLCADWHQQQHQHGESAIYPGTEDEAKEQLAKGADRYRLQWASKALARKIAGRDVESRSEVMPDQVADWVEQNGLQQFVTGRVRKLIGWAP